jgi:hypothetical protein
MRFSTDQAAKILANIRTYTTRAIAAGQPEREFSPFATRGLAPTIARRAAAQIAADYAATR